MARLRQPIPKTGPVKGRWLAYHEKSKRIVMARCLKNGALHCEGCGAVKALDWAHLAGRRHIVAEPYASSPELTVGLCRTCHDRVDRALDPALAMKLRNLAAFRFATTHRMVRRYWQCLSLRWEPLEIIRELVSCVEKEEKTPA